MSRPIVPWPATVRTFRVVAVVRVLVAVASLAAAAIVLPHTFDAMSRRVESGRAGDPTVPRLQLSGLGSVAAVAGAVFGLAVLAGWVFCAWKVLTGRRWAALVVGIFSAYTAASGVLSAAVLLVQRFLPQPLIVGLPSWYLAVTVLAVLVDATVVVLLVLPATRAWIRACNPPASPVPWPPPYGYAPPPPGWPH